MKISLVIPAYNEANYIGACLDNAIKNSNGRFCEIIVINNASTDQTKEIALSKGVRVVDESRKGLTKARQRGLVEASGDYIAYVDADTHISPKWFDTIERSFKRRPDMVCLSGPYRYYDAAFIPKTIMTGLWYLSAPLTYRLVGYMVLGGNFIAKKEAMFSVGGFDESIDFYGEDTDIARRLNKAGKVVFDMSFYVHTSCRRLKKEGIFLTNLRYGLNFIWQVVFHRPFTKKYNDIRKI